MSVNDLSNISQTDWAALEAMTDEEIDYSDISPLTDKFFENATLRIPVTKSQNLIELDPDVMEWFRAQDKEHKTLINSVLRRYIEDRKKES